MPGNANANGVPFLNVFKGEWTPAQIPTLLWLDAADSNTITESGGLVSKWDDKSGNNNDATQGTGAIQPVTNSRTMNGLNILDFQEKLLLTAALNPVQTGGLLVFIVSEFDSSASVLGGLYGFTGGTPFYFYSFLSDNTTQFDGKLDFVNMGTDYNINNPPHNGPSTYCAKLDYAADIFDMIIDGTSQGTTALVDGRPIVADATLRLGSDGSSVNRIKCGISELIIAETDISDNTRQDIEGYLAWKWSGEL
jgi:hypothetical protein